MEQLFMDIKREKIDIDGIEYEIEIFLSISDQELLSISYEENKKDYRDVIAKIISKHFVDKDNSIDTLKIRNMSEGWFEKYFEMLFQRYNGIKKDYELQSVEISNSERFVIAVKLQYEEKYKAIYNSPIPKISIDTSKISNAINQQYNYSDVIKNMSAMLSAFSNEALSAFNIGDSIAKSMKKALEPLCEQMANVRKNFQTWFDNYGKKLSEILSQITLSTLSEEDKKRINENYRIWGEYGWTIIPNAPIYLFNEAPLDKKEANKIALTHCKNEQMQTLFDELKIHKKIKKDDFYEMVFAFNNKKYKSCAMLLISSIEALMIRKQGAKRGDRKLIGSKAGKKALGNIMNDYDMDTVVYILFSYTNLMAAIDNLFENGNNFEKQPSTLNRNFLTHGMMTRKVKRMECIQLFLLYYNLLYFIDRFK